MFSTLIHCQDCVPSMRQMLPWQCFGIAWALEAVKIQSLVGEKLVRGSLLYGGGLLQCLENSRVAPSPSKPPVAPNDRIYSCRK